MAHFTTIQGAALTGLDGPGGAMVLIEVWNETGTTGLALVPAPNGLAPMVAACRQALAPTAVEPPPTSWLEPSLAWAAWGAAQAARADLGARAAGVPLWLWLGGSASDSSLAPAPTPEDRIVGAPESGWPALERRVLERSIDVIRVWPLAVGGPGGVARLDAIARAWQLELAIAAETPLLVSRALAIHLGVTMVTAMPAGRGNDSQAVPWLRAADEGSDVKLPSAPGLGVILDRDGLVATGVQRLVVA